MTNTLRFRTRRRGAALIELAIAWPVVSLLFFCVIDYARLMGTYGSVSNAARAAAQRAMNDTPTYALAASSDPTAWSNLETAMRTAATQSTTLTGMTTTIVKTFACPSGDGGESAHQTTVPTCSNYRTYVRVKSQVNVSAWAPIPKIAFPSTLAGTAMVRVK